MKFNRRGLLIVVKLIGMALLHLLYFGGII